MPEGVDAGPDSLGPLMDAQVPAVVAVVVTTDPGPWLEEALSSLAAQDYEELSVLVLSTGEDDPEVTERVARVLPDAFVRHLPGRPGYAAASNEALGMVEGAAFFLLLHDDVALDPDAVHKLVEESFRSNAGVVSPKFVNWDDPRVLLHVGMSCDKTGAVVDRITEGEVDHGQHDAVRDVFVAPGGCILVRADLFAELKGFDAGNRRHGGGPRPLVAQPGGGLARRRGAGRAGASPRGGRRRAGAAGRWRTRPRGPPPRHHAVAAAAPRAACRPQVLHPSQPACGCCRRRRSWPSVRSSSPCSPAIANGSGPSPEPGGGTSAG